MSISLDRDLGPLLYAPKWVRDERRVQELIEEIQKLTEFRQPSPTPPSIVDDGGMPRWLMPEAAWASRGRLRVGMFVCFSLAIAVAAIAAPFAASKFPNAGTMAVAGERNNETPSFESRLSEQGSNVAERPRPPQLSVNQEALRNRGEAFPLAVTVVGSAVGASVVVDGLAAGSTLTVGGPLGTNGWRLAAVDLRNALVRPPKGFAGPMDVVLELRLADDTVVDRKSLRLEWAAAAPEQSTGHPIRQLDRQEMADLMRRGQEFIAAGDLASARLVLQRAAEAGDPRAARMLAETYDPVVRFPGQTSASAESPSSPPAPTLVASQAAPRRTGEAFPLGVSVRGPADGALLAIGGLANGARLSAGQPAGDNSWRLSAADLKDVILQPPQDFVGAMDLTIELRLADDTLADRRSLRFEWAAGGLEAKPRAHAIHQLDPDEIARLLKRGDELIASGDLAAARLVLQRAAEAGDARGALALAGTYDPMVLEKLPLHGFAPNIAMARSWYEKARQFGSADASRRLEMLASRRD